MNISKSQMKLALIKAGQKTAQLTEDELRAAYARLTGTPAPEAPKPAPDLIELDERYAPLIDVEEEPEDDAPPEAPKPAPKRRKAVVAGNKAEQLADLLSGLVSAPEVDEERLIELIKEHAHHTTTVEIKKSKKSTKIEGAHKSLKTVIDWLSMGEHVYAYGPAGSGKTTLAEQAAEALGLDFYKTGAVYTKYELVGFVDATGSYHTTGFREAFEKGGLYLQDEMDSSAAEALVAMNDALSNGSYAFPDSPKPVKRHADFIVMGSANTLGKGADLQYVGRNPLDAATRNRYMNVHVQYDLDVERTMSTSTLKQYGDAAKQAELQAAFEPLYHEIKSARALIDERRFGIVLSPRDTVRVAKAVAAGMPAEAIRDEIIYVDFSADQKKQAAV